ncbi:putative pyroglutamyl peptidase type I [Xylogone sp. PMI_703]|nr:putative pyroglutamyl peptidase type I [Xylogone sp. PMI_703]
MGSTTVDPATWEDEFTILVTGFAPFTSRYPVNPSWEIARALPPFLPPSSSGALSSKSSDPNPSVRILVHPEPVKVAYKNVRELVPNLWERAAGPKLDLVLHIGMASGRTYYSAERRAHRDGYAMRDVDGELLGDEDKVGEEFYWHGLPHELKTTLDVDEVWRTWKKSLPDCDIRISEDPGRYLCDFIYYSSLAHLYRKGEDARVLFLHVPVDSDPASVKTGVDITIELIRAAVKNLKAKQAEKQAEA